MLDVLKAVILGIVQGLTEFLPVSSTGHLIVFEKAFGLSADTFGLTFDAALHLGTLLAVLVYFWRQIWRLLAAWLASIRAWQWNMSQDSRLAWLLFIAIWPAVVVGLPLESTMESTFRSPALVAAVLILFSGVFVLAERAEKQRRENVELGVADARETVVATAESAALTNGAPVDGGETGVGLAEAAPVARRGRTMRAIDAMGVGVAQAIAVIPGVSRSGATISAGLFAKLNREQAAVFAFLLSVPTLGGAGMKKLYDVTKEANAGTLTGSDLRFFAVGFVAAAVAGYFAIHFLLGFVRKHTLYPFVYYRVAFGAVVLALVALRVL